VNSQTSAINKQKTKEQTNYIYSRLSSLILTIHHDNNPKINRHIGAILNKQVSVILNTEVSAYLHTEIMQINRAMMCD
jgi:hypothetical protein